VRAGAFGTAAFSLSFLLLATAFGHAQSPPAASPPLPPAPLPGFVPPYEITKIVRASGFDPLAPPRREGTTYVLRATDFRGILFRIVVDARSGAIRAANRIVPGSGPYGSAGIMAAGPYPPPYGAPPPYGMIAPPPYGPPGMAGPEMGPEEAEFGPPMGPPGPPPPGIRSSMYPPAAGPLGPGGSSGAGSGSLTSAPPEGNSPPLPRPRPAGLAAREAQPPVKPSEPPTAKPDAAPAASSAPAAVPPPAAVAPTPAAPTAPKKPLSSTPIPD
jgi:hypothetical protein